MTTRKYTSRSQQTTLTSAITSGATSMTVASATTLLATVGSGEFVSGATFTVVLDPDTALEEIVDITAASSNTFSITRSIDAIGTAQDHSAGAVVRHMIIGRDLRESNTHIEASSSVHGLSSTGGVVVGTAATQTLTNKTLTAPIVAGATLSGTITSTATITGGTLTGAIVTGLTSSGLADTQATPKNYVDAILVLQTASQTAAATSASSAATSATSASNSATAAASSASAASTSATSAAASATTAANSVATIVTSATSAANSATAAASSATAAATSASSAATSRTSSLTSQTAAATSAASAATSASSAATSAASAAASATAAATSATSAAASATTAANSVAAIQTSATSAANSATAAATSAASAATSASSAAASTSAAATSAASAATSATSAAASASAASTSATSAAASASAASTSATSAAASQSAASTSASSASASATSAANSATTATTQAAAASTSATSASVSATAAATSASSAATSAASAAVSATQAAGYVVPSQTGNAGKLLGTNGTAVAWTSNLVNPNIENGLKAKIAITSTLYIRDYDGTSVGDYRSGTSYPMVGIQNAGNVWVGAGYTNSGNTYVYSSTDGITWSFLDFIGAFGFTHDSNCKVAYNGSVFVVSGGSGDLGITTNITDYARVATPPTFTDSSQAYRATISSFNGYFFLPDFAGSNMFYSSDGNTWNSSSLPTTANWSSTAYGAGKYVVVANDSATAAYATSPSGTWTSITMPSTGYQSVTYDGSKFIAIGNATLATSTDGVTWTAQTFTESGEWSIAYSAGGYIATAVNTALTYVLTSTDGITWSQYDLSASTSSVKFKIGYIKSQPNSGTLNITGGSGTNGQVVVSTGAGVKWGSPGAATPTVSGTVYGQTTDANNGTDYHVTGVGYNVFDNSIFNPADAQRNTGVGSSVLKNLTYGMSNNVVGSYETSITTGSYNTLMGDRAGPSITTAYYNTAVGTEALRDTTTSNYNVALGSFAGATNITGSGVTAVGYMAGLYNKQNNNTFLGLEAGNISGQYDGYTNTNVTAIGYSAAPSSKTVNDEITLGNSSISTIRANVTSITSLSDERDKTAIEPLTVGLDFVNELKPVQFEWNMRDGGKVGQLDAGFIAQDLVAAEDATGLADYLQLTMRENPEKLEATQGRLIPILVKAIQELSAEVKALKEGK